MYKSIQRLRLTKSERVLVMHAPESFQEFEQYFTASIDREIKGRAYPCVFYFTRSMEQTGIEITAVLRALAYDGLFWFCYPRTVRAGGISRNDVKEFFKPHKMELVAQRHINEQWTASRIRPKELVNHKGGQHDT